MWEMKGGKVYNGSCPKVPGKPGKRCLQRILPPKLTGKPRCGLGTLAIFGWHWEGSKSDQTPKAWKRPWDCGQDFLAGFHACELTELVCLKGA